MAGALVVFGCEQSRGQGFLDLGYARERGYVREVEVGEAHGGLVVGWTGCHGKGQDRTE